MKKEVVVTGMGVVSCFGNDIDTYYNNLLAGNSGVKTIEQFKVDDLPTQFAAYIENFDAGEYLDKKQARRVDPAIAYCMVAGKKAVEHAGLSTTLNKSRTGVLVGSGIGGMGVFNEGVITTHDKGPRRLSPFFIPYVLTNMSGALLAMDLGVMGPNYSISTACATSNNAILSALHHIRRGDADVMICGGTEAPINRIGIAGFCSCKALSGRNDDPQGASRPWDKGRDGFVMGEGAGVLVLETREHAQKRGAKILATLHGGGMSCDAHHMTEPHPEGRGVALCIEHALKDSEIDPARINYINAHATSTPVGDMAEINAVKGVLPNTSNVVINGTKSMTGHSLGAAGGLEAIAVIKAIQEGKVHPTINLQDPEEGLDFIVPTKAYAVDIDIALSNSFGFGGHNATLVFGR